MRDQINQSNLNDERVVVASHALNIIDNLYQNVESPSDDINNFWLNKIERYPLHNEEK